MKKQVPAILNFKNRIECIDAIYGFEDIKTFGSEAKFILSGVTLRNVQGLTDSLGNRLYDSVNRLIGGFPYEIDTKLDTGVIIFDEETDDMPEPLGYWVDGGGKRV